MGNDERTERRRKTEKLYLGLYAVHRGFFKLFQVPHELSISTRRATRRLHRGPYLGGYADDSGSGTNQDAGPQFPSGLGRADRILGFDTALCE
jgi:hypothetical protein